MKNKRNLKVGDVVYAFEANSPVRPAFLAAGVVKAIGEDEEEKFVIVLCDSEEMLKEVKGDYPWRLGTEERYTDWAKTKKEAAEIACEQIRRRIKDKEEQLKLERKRLQRACDAFDSPDGYTIG